MEEDGTMGHGQGQGKRHSPLIVSLLEPALLILVKGEPSHGYSLLAELGEMGIDTLHPSVVYRTLREMEDLEWIQSDWELIRRKALPGGYTT